MNLQQRRAKLDDLKEIVSLLADDKLGRAREQAGDEVAQEYLDAFAKINGDPNQYLMVLENDLALTVPDKFKLSDEVIERVLLSGRYAITTHKGSRDNIGDTIYGLYREQFPESGEELGDLPCIFCYHNFDHEVAETELLTEIWVLLK